MRVIAGTRRSLPLKAPKSMKTRPTTDRIKETLFNILNPYLPGTRFLDLFSGSGAIGIEALSRGASRAVFVERDREAEEIIRENLKFTRFAEEGKVIRSEVLSYLSGQTDGPFDLVFLDPPYDSTCVTETLSALKRPGILSDDALIVVETDLLKDLTEWTALGYVLLREKKYKTNRHLFLKKE